MPLINRPFSTRWTTDENLEYQLEHTDGTILVDWTAMVPAWVIDPDSGRRYKWVEPDFDTSWNGWLHVREVAFPLHLETEVFEPWPASSAGGAGTGARTIVVPVRDAGGNPVNAATVRFSAGPTSSVGASPANGNHTTGLDDGTYTLTVTFPNKQSVVRQEVIAADATLANVVLNDLASIVPPADPALCRIYGTMRKKDAVTANPGGVLRWRLLDGPNTAGFIFSRGENEAVADGNGLVQFDVPVNAAVEVAVGTGGAWHTVDAGVGPTKAIDETLGQLGED